MIMADFVIKGRERNLGSLAIYRSLPVAKKRQLGPYVFLDHMGPTILDGQHAMDVAPHPHIGLSTVTYLFEGRGLHRDNIGSVQMITPGDLNIMTAGRGIAHSERTPQEDRDSGMRLHGVQIWVGLPAEEEECEPSFQHYPKDILPITTLAKGLSGKLMIGEYNNVKSPVKVYSKTLFMELKAESDVATVLSFNEKEVGILLIAGEAAINGQQLEVEDLIVLGQRHGAQLKLSKGAHLIVIGGDPFPEERFIWWNYVSSKKENIRIAADDWKHQRLPRVEGEVDFIPLPDIPLP